MEDYSMYLYYKGEEENPFYGWENDGKRFWWNVESYAHRKSDKKEYGKLSKTMLSFLKEWHYEPSHNRIISWEEAERRANIIYNKGIFDNVYFDTETIEEADKIIENETKANYQFPGINII